MIADGAVFTNEIVEASNCNANYGARRRCTSVVSKRAAKSLRLTLRHLLLTNFQALK